MSFRVTQSIVASSSRQQVQRSFARLYDSQLAVSTGKKINRPSDDPQGISRLLAFKGRSSELKQYSRNSSDGKTFVSSAASALQEASSVIIDLRGTVVQALNGSTSPDDRVILANQIEGYLEDLIGIANSQVGDRFLFAGTETGRAPFVRETDASGQERVNYRGNGDAIHAEVGPNLTSALNVPGSAIFLNNGRGETTFQGTTGATVGLGANSGRGVDTLEVRNSGTTIAGASGLGNGTSSANNTIIGNHSVEIIDNGTGGGTISLNGGTPVAYIASDTDLQVVGPNGEKVFVSAFGIGSGFSGSVTLQGQGTLSIDGGATTTAIDFSSNQQLSDSLTGEILNVNSSSLTQAGDDKVSYGGTLDLFSSIIAIRDALRDGGSGAELNDNLERVSSYLAELDKSHTKLTAGAGRLGNLESRLESAENRLADLDLRITELISKTEDVDLSEAIINLNQNETTYQSALLVTSRVNQLSLLNYF